MNIILRTIITLIILYIILKIIGMKQLTQMNFFDYIIGITIGSIVADISLDIEKDYLIGILSLLIYTTISILVSKICQKSVKLRTILNGKPTILIEKGKILTTNLNKVNININELLSEARIMGYFDISKIDYAIMETSGRISFLPLDKYQTITKDDMKIKSKQSSYVYNVIIDTVLIEDILEEINKDKKWLDKELKVLGYNNYTNILLLTIDTNNKIKVFNKN